MGFHIKIIQPAVATIANRGLHVDSPGGFGGRRHRFPSSIDELYFCDSERLMSIFFCSADALADGHENAQSLYPVLWQITCHNSLTELKLLLNNRIGTC